MKNDIPIKLKKAIDSSGLTLIELEKKTGISKSAIQRYASGITDKIPIDAVVAIAEATGVSAPYIMGWVISPEPIPTATEIKKSFSDNLAFYMNKHNLSNKEIAGIAGVREKKVAQWLTGESNPRLPALQNMAEHFGVTVHDLISGTPIKSAEDVIKNMLLSVEVSDKIGYDPKLLDDERIKDITEALVSFLKLTVK